MRRKGSPSLAIIRSVAAAADPLEAGALPLGYELRAEQSSAFAVIGENLYPLVRLSPEGAWLWIGDELGSLRDGEVLTLSLEVDGVETAAIRAQVLRRPSSGTQEPLQLQFSQLPVMTARQIAALLEDLRGQGVAAPPRVQGSVRERIEDPERIGTLCSLLARNRSRGLLRAGDAPPVRLTACGLDPEAGSITWEVRSRIPEPPFRIEWVGYSNQYAFTVEELQWQNGFLTTPVPARLLRCRRRAVARARVPDGLEVRFRHPLWPEVMVQRTVRDVSYRGLGFWSDPVEDLLYPGLRIADLQVSAGDLPPVNLCAEVRLVAPEDAPDDSRGRAVGLRVTPAGERDAAAWARLVGKMLHPSTSTGMDRAADVWSALQGSGYFRLSGKSADFFEPWKTAYLRTAGKLRGHPELSSQVVEVDGLRRVESTLSMLKGFEHTWIAHHGARRPGMAAGSPPRHSLREVWLRALEESAADPEARHLACFVEGNVRWLKSALLDFARSRQAGGQAYVGEIALFEGHPCAAELPLPSGVEVGAPSPGELRAVLDAYQRAMPRLYVEAFDLVPARFDLGRLRPAWQAAGLKRARAMRVARLQGRAVAAAVLDDAEPGVNLFGVFSGVRLIALSHLDEQARDAAFVALLRDAGRWYGDRGTEQFVYYREVEDGGHALDAGYTPLGPGFIWLQSTSLMGEWTEHVYELTSPRAPEPD